MNDKLAALLEVVQRTAIQAGDVAADAAYGMGKKAGAVGFALYLDLLENLAPRKKTMDVDVLLLYDGNTDMVQLAENIRNIQVPGGYRITEPGAALQMDVIWDGQNLIHSLSRIISVD